MRQGLLPRLVLPLVQWMDYRNGLLHVVDMLGTSRASYILGEHLQPPNNVSILFYFLFKTESCYAAQVGPKSLCLSHPPASPSEYGGTTGTCHTAQ